MHGDLLRYADKEWLTQVARGLAWVCNSRRALLMMVLGFLVFLIVGLVVIPAAVGTVLEGVFQIVGGLISWAIALMPIGIGVGMWMAPKPEPRSEHGNPYQSAAIRALSVGVIAALAIWAMSSRRNTVIATSFALQQAVVHVCFVIVWLHALVVVRQAKALGKRCAGFGSKQSGEISRMQRQAISASLLFLLIYWIGPLRWAGTGIWTLPGTETARMMFYASVLGWLSVTGVYATALKLIREELAELKPGDSATGGTLNEMMDGRLKVS